MNSNSSLSHRTHTGRTGQQKVQQFRTVAAAFPHAKLLFCLTQPCSAATKTPNPAPCTCARHTTHACAQHTHTALEPQVRARAGRARRAINAYACGLHGGVRIRGSLSSACVHGEQFAHLCALAPCRAAFRAKVSASPETHTYKHSTDAASEL